MYVYKICVIEKWPQCAMCVAAAIDCMHHASIINVDGSVRNTVIMRFSIISAVH